MPISVRIVSFSHLINDCVPIRLLHYGRNYVNLCSSLWFQYLIDSLPHSKHSINIIKWLNESLRSQEFLFCPIVYSWWKTASVNLIKLIKNICYWLQAKREGNEEGQKICDVKNIEFNFIIHWESKIFALLRETLSSSCRKGIKLT